MKKLFSLVALVFVFSSFSTSNLENQKKLETTVIKFKVENSMGSSDVCFSYASQVADQWMQNTGGNWSDSVAVFDRAMSFCNYVTSYEFASQLLNVL